MLVDIPPLIDITFTTPASGEQPKITDWLSAVVAFVALIIAGLAARANFLTNANQARQLDALEKETVRQAQERRATQAALVSGWLEEIQNSTGPDNFTALVFQFKNRAEQPVYSVAMKVEVGVRGGFYRHIGTIGPDSLWQVRIELPGYPRGQIEAPEFAFRDSLNRHWRRAHNGELTEITREEYANFFYEHPGAFESVTTHPTLHQKTPGEGVTRLS